MGVTIASMGTLQRMIHRVTLPAFQRPYVWAPGQAEWLLDSLTRGYPIGAILLWEPPWGGQAVVLDGQQRFTAITGYRPGGEYVHTVCWVPGERKWRVFKDPPAGVWALSGELHLGDLRRLDLPEVERVAACEAYDNLRFRAGFPVHVVEGTAQDAVEAFRRVNLGGVRMGEEEVNELTLALVQAG
jgi:hypothetical protein